MRCNHGSLLSFRRLDGTHKEMYQQWLADVKLTEEEYGALERDHSTLHESTVMDASQRGRSLERSHRDRSGSRGKAEDGLRPATLPVPSRAANNHDDGAGLKEHSRSYRSTVSVATPGSPVQSRSRSSTHQRNHMLSDLRQVSQHKLVPLNTIRGANADEIAQGVESCALDVQFPYLTT